MGLIANLVVTFVPFLYWPVLESSRWQATVGKRIMGLQVTDADGGRLSFVHALLRMLAKIVSSIPLGLGFVIAAFTARKQALHDLIVKTLVVRSGPSQLWKIVLALIIGLVLMVASAAGLFYYVVMPMFKKMFSEPVLEASKGSPERKTIPAPAAGQPQIATAAASATPRAGTPGCWRPPARKARTRISTPSPASRSPDWTSRTRRAPGRRSSSSRRFFATPSGSRSTRRCLRSGTCR